MQNNVDHETADSKASDILMLEPTGDAWTRHFFLSFLCGSFGPPDPTK